MSMGAVVAGLTACSSTGGTTLRFDDENTVPVAYHVDGTKFLLSSTTRFTAGDYLNFDNPDFQGRSTEAVAHDHASCHVTGTTASGSVPHGWCKNVFDFANGTLTVARAAWNGNGVPFVESGAVTSGTGQYAGAHGSIVFSPASRTGKNLVAAVTLTYTT